MAFPTKDTLKKMTRAGATPGASVGADQGPARMRPGMADIIAGEAKDFRTDLSPFLPSEIFGGSLPHIPGTEEEAVWNAASQACGTERVHYCYTVDDGRCWYLAVPSVALASAPDTWCPLAAALPGNSEYWDRETVYLYEQEGMASALRWDPETARMQVYIGAARTLLPRIQSMDANFVTINPDVATIIPWRNRALRTEKLSRATAMVLLYSGLAVSFLAVGVIVLQFLMTGFVKRDLAKVKADSEKLSNDLMINAYGALQSDTIRHMVRIQELLDTLRTIEGTLVRYEVKGGKVEWEALVPKSFSQGVGPIRGTIKPGIEGDGRVRLVGTS
ncbi:hypothetical protein [Micavibrio aeruginosavorus]|uniref:Uncharacterized protein n=2 Tax=Micavibrio aeruginosavorus TaxID=349221 RepID=G2KNJ7_MICAA|nr:hypothetical protein [Micavibrio aeruginosavorus]AEP10242.1 hypothetical protein MICA_1933 [Micavibrio aeruginosavorus ARL-13]AGH98646.1 hypothetical protein A11S_1844 [Micavibrio aeruginosavorus EPB]